MKFNRANIDHDTLVRLYTHMIESRLIEEKMLILLRQGKVSKWFSGIGQEAISVGVTLALEEDEFIFPMHRNLGVFTSRHVPISRLFSQWQGKSSGFTKGRDRSFHFGAPEFHIVGMISHLGPQLSLADGVALANVLNNRNKVAVAFTGEGGTSQGEFHEALNVASVWKLPVIFIIENNGYGLSTPTNEQYACENLADRGKGYGMRSVILDGNNILKVYDTIRTLAEEIRRSPEPVLVECKTFRVRGHEEASGIKYVPKELIEAWVDKDPVISFESFLLDEGIITKDEILAAKTKIKNNINTALEEAFAEPPVSSTEYSEIADVFAKPSPAGKIQPGATKREMRFVDAISDGLEAAMFRHPDLILMGQDIAEYGGVFKITEGFYEKFGLDRVRNTPLCESAIIGIAAGLSISGIKSMVEMQFADFVSCGFNQIVNNLAKMHYRWSQNMDVVIRMPTGAGVGAGPFHSQSNEAWFTHTPGLKVVYPSDPVDAKGLLLASFEDPNPVIFFEHKALYRNISEAVPVDYYIVEIGKAKLVHTGGRCSIISYGAGVHWAKEYIQSNGLDADLLDLRTLAPLDYEAIEASVKKTGRVIIVQEDVEIGGIASDISAYIAGNLFDFLDAPVLVCASLSTPVPFAGNLEKQFLAKARMGEMIERLLAY